MKRKAKYPSTNPMPHVTGEASRGCPGKTHVLPSPRDPERHFCGACWLGECGPALPCPEWDWGARIKCQENGPNAAKNGKILLIAGSLRAVAIRKKSPRLLPHCLGQRPCATVTKRKRAGGTEKLKESHLTIYICNTYCSVPLSE